MSDINDALNRPGNGTEGEQPADESQPAEASPPMGQALPGPHPHEAADIRATAGDVAKWEDPMKGFTDPEQS